VDVPLVGDLKTVLTDLVPLWMNTITTNG